MVVVTLESLDRYKGLSMNFNDAIEWIEDGSWRNLSDGRYPIDGTRIHALILSGDSKPLESCAFEIHRRYADIQILIQGKEYVLVRAAHGMPVTIPYSAEKEIEFLGDGPGVAEHRVTLGPGVAAIFFPEDAHKPCIAISGPTGTKKLVVKVEVV